jgi:RNA polymerase sigma-70 factor (ECF subfamily)
MLLLRCADGDRDAFRMLYDRQAGKLYGIALRITRQANLAADAVQEAFLQVWQNARAFNPERGSPEAWMIGVTRYRALDLLRRAGPQTAELSPDLHASVEPSFEPISGTADGRALAQCLERIEPDRRKLVLLAFVDGYSHAELANRAAMPLGTVKSVIRRALAALRDCLSA